MKLLLRGFYGCNRPGTVRLCTAALGQIPTLDSEPYSGLL